FGCVLAALVAVVVLLPVGGSAKLTHRSAGLTVVDLGVLQQLNEIRRTHHLAPLTLSASLDAAAMQHSRDMLTNGFFAHDSSNGKPFWKRIKAFYPEARYGYWSVAETLFWTPGSATVGESIN